MAKCSLAVPQDEHVIKLTQELAQKLGFKIRKAYVRAELSLKAVPGDGAPKVGLFYRGHASEKSRSGGLRS